MISINFNQLIIHKKIYRKKKNLGYFTNYQFLIKLEDSISKIEDYIDWFIVKFV